MKKLTLFIILFAFVACGNVKYVPVKETVNVRDSVILKDSTIFSYINKEIVKEIVPVYDTLILNSTYAKSISYVDTTTHTLKGTLSQKDTIPVKTKIVYKDKIREKVIYQEVAVPVEIEKKVIPKWVWYSLGLNILIFVIFIVRLKIT